MTVDEMKAALQTELQAFKSSLGQYAEKADLDKKFEELKGQLAEAGMKKEIGDLQAAIEKQGLEINRLNENKGGEQSLRDILVGELKKAIEAGEQKRAHKFEIKTNVLRTSVTNHTLAQRLTDIGQLAYGSTGLDQLFRQANVGGNSNGVIRYVDQSSVTRNAAPKAEGTAAPESAIAWQEYTLAIQKILDSIPVSFESLNDVDFIEGEIRRLLDVNMMIKLNQQYWAGTGTAPEIKGIYTYASAFDADAYAAGSGIKVAGASLYDLLAILRVQITNGKQSKYAPNLCILNPADVLKMKLAKDEMGQYVLPPFTTQAGMVVDGMTVYENSAVTANTMLLGDSRFATSYNLGGIELEMGYGDGQFITDLYTLKARKRCALLVRNADVDAFLKVTDITAAITAVTPAP